MILVWFVAATAWGETKPKKLVSRHRKAPATSAPVSERPAAPSTAPAPTTASPEPPRDLRQLVVVGVYRPVEMQGRTVTVAREVYLQAVDGQGDKVGDLRGQALEVYRKVPVPAAVAAVQPPDGSASVSPGLPAAPAPAAAPATRAPEPPAAAPSTALSAVARLRALKKAQEQVRAGGAPASSASPAPAVSVESAAPGGGGAPSSALLQPSAGAADRSRTDIARPRPKALETMEMEVVIGRLHVVEIRGQVVVARVAEDGVRDTAAEEPAQGRGRKKPPQPPAGTFAAELPAIMAGDLARFVVAPPPPAAPPPAVSTALTAEEQARLDAERKRAEAERRRRKNPRSQYQRDVMKWKL